ncbi:MAG TPA: hypothetical protein VFE36_13680, partial [Candidatus Baltobacteraceae bacterium]|nr:hypothetical protein [Candidatus Baltobacteraceae bacterium]
MTFARASSIAGLLLALSTSGCGKIQTIPASPNPAVRIAEFAGSWMKAEAKNADLLYVSDLNRNAVFVFTYPAGEHVGTLKGLKRPHGECVDTAGNVWVTNGLDFSVVEYAHGGTSPIAKVSDPNGFPSGCAVDSVTGNLAVMNFSPGSGAGNVVVYAGAKGSPQQLPLSPAAIPYKGAYDAKGNLWVDGMTSSAKYFSFGEYLAAKHRWRPIILKHVMYFPSGVQWVGGELVVGDQVNLSGPSTVYEFSMRRGAGKLVGTTPLANSCDVLEFAVIGKTIVATNTCEKAIRYFAFPKGGTSTKVIRSGLSQPIGV